ncbi:MAG: hypothetical protein Ta2E_04440 [Mycoplasmoidaceae bacterium]|nr:MAG: hypothetical protein Ta2E_04440 [Mycoplasmoidaceae bacterium]
MRKRNLFTLILTIVLVIGIAIPITLWTCKKREKYEPTFYLDSNDLYAGSSYDTCSIKPINTTSHDNFSIVVDSRTFSDQIEDAGWVGNSYFIRYKNIVSVDDAYINVTIKNNKKETSDVQKVYLHNLADTTAMINNNEKIKQTSVHIYGTNNKQGVSGTAWIIKHLTAGDSDYSLSGSDYQYYLLTNWHVSDLFDQYKSKTFSYGFSSGEETSAVHQFDSFRQVSAATIQNNDNIGSDTYLLYADFGDFYSSNFDDVNSLCDSNGYAYKLHNDSSPIEDEVLFIGGYPIINKSSRSYKYYYIQGRADKFYGYKNKNWDKPEELSTMSHYLNNKKKWTIGNDIILKPSVCDKLMGGSSGSIVLDSVGAIVGIYWGGRNWTGTNAYCGNIETLYKINNSPICESGEFLDYSLSPNSEYTWFNQLNDIQTAP